jgi:GT2 family glycosyltransferase
MGLGDPRVAVVIITRNRREELLRTLGHLTALSERPRIVVVDNGSDDDTVSAVAEHFPGVTVLAAGANLGAAGRNLGVSRLDAPYIAFCDDDTWWEPGSMRHAADLFDAHVRLAVLTAHIILPGRRADPVCTELEDSPLPAEPGMPGRPLLGFLAGASMIRREAFLAVGGYEPRFSVGGEEELLAWDLAAAGWWLCYAPELTVHHHPSPRRNAGTRRGLLLRNALWCAWMRRPWPAALRRSGRLLTSAPRDGVTLRGLAGAVAGLPWVLRRRRVLPPAVERGLRLIESPRRTNGPRAAVGA